MSWRTDCRHFNGYRPCPHGGICQGCGLHEPAGPEVLVIHLDALGDVLRNTAILPGIGRALPGARVTWLTRPRAAPLIRHNPLIHRVMELGSEAVWELEARRFDLLLAVDKGPVTGGLAARITAREKRGFGVDHRGVVVPLNEEAGYLYATGLDDDLKFRKNQKSEQMMLAEALCLPYRREPYRLVLPPEIEVGSPRLVGINTGSSTAWVSKRMPPEAQARIVQALAEVTGEPVLLLGGPEDHEVNVALVATTGGAGEYAPVAGDILAGAAQVARCGVVVTGDSLGMHMAVALGCHVAAWFGPTCPQEIDLYDRGVKLLAPVPCRPCWRTVCPEEIPCGSLVEPADVVRAVELLLEARGQRRPIDAVWELTAR